MIDRSDHAARIMALHGLPFSPTSRPAVPGVVNTVTIVGPPGDRHVVRWPRSAHDHAGFVAESWVSTRARAAGVPTPEVVATGVLDGVPYSVHRFADGRDGTSVRSPELWHTLGRYAALIAAVPLDGTAPECLFSRFGRDLPAAWQAHLAYNRDMLDADDPLLGLGVMSSSDQARVRAAVDRLADATPVHGLVHGDLALRNVVVPDEGPAVLIDWGAATTGPAPFTALLQLLRGRDQDGSPDAAELEAFADGYGIDLTTAGPTLVAMRLLAAVDLVRWARDRRPDRLGETAVAARVLLERADASP